MKPYVETMAMIQYKEVYSLTGIGNLTVEITYHTAGIPMLEMRHLCVQSSPRFVIMFILCVKYTETQIEDIDQCFVFHSFQSQRRSYL